MLKRLLTKQTAANTVPELTAVVPSGPIMDDTAASIPTSTDSRESLAPSPSPKTKRHASRALPDGVLTAPGGVLHHLNPALAEQCALVRSNGELTFYVLTSFVHAAEIDSFRKSAENYLKEPVPFPRASDRKEIRGFNISQSEILHAASATGSRAKLKDIIASGAAARANDIKIDIINDSAIVRFQKDGYLSHAIRRYDMTAEEATSLITSAFNYADQGDPVEKPTKDQKFTITSAGKLPDRVQTVRGQIAVREDGRRLDLRIIYKNTEISKKGLNDLGFLPRHMENLYYVQNVGAGLFTITAPVENGKSTTLNIFCMDMVQAKDFRIDMIGVDDPVEFMTPEICQLAMYEIEDGGDPFAQKIHTSLRLAPHGVKIGECRTGQTANAAIDAAVTGKLVMTTQHTTGVFTIPFRYERMGVDRHVAYDPATHICWMSQRLVPGLCPHCSPSIFALPKEITNDVRRMSSIRKFLPILAMREGDFRVRGLGCTSCQEEGDLFAYPGLDGRVLAAEVILPSRRICELLAAGNDSEARRTTILEDSTPTMALHGLLLMSQGLIGCEEFMQTIALPETLRADLEADDEHFNKHRVSTVFDDRNTRKPDRRQPGGAE